jgi:hypothetical protein
LTQRPYRSIRHVLLVAAGSLLCAAPSAVQAATVPVKDTDARLADYRHKRSTGKCAAKSAGSKACMKVRWRIDKKAEQ